MQQFGFQQMPILQSSERVLNIDILNQLVEDIGYQRVNVVVEMSITDLKKLFAEINSSGKVSDWTSLRIAAHSLLGVSSIIGAEKLRTTAQELEFNCEKRNYFMAYVLVADTLLAILEFVEKLELFRNLEDETSIMARHQRKIVTKNIQLQTIEPRTSLLY
jgi:HPt (histidine-containing phosphotransfer) domain-containing protein